MTALNAEDDRIGDLVLRFIQEHHPRSAFQREIEQRERRALAGQRLEDQRILMEE